MLDRLRKFRDEHYIIADERPSYLGHAEGLVSEYEDLVRSLIFELEMWEDEIREEQDDDEFPERTVRPQPDVRGREG